MKVQLICFIEPKQTWRAREIWRGKLGRSEKNDCRGSYNVKDLPYCHFQAKLLMGLGCQ